VWLTLAVTGCSAGGPGDEPLGRTQQAICASGAVVHGVDVSSSNGTVNWSSVKAAGEDFAIARISDGLTADAQFDANWAGIKSAGMIRGAYQLFQPSDDPVAQANTVVQKVGVLGAGDLPIVADVEVTGGQSAATIVANLQTWVTQVETGTGKTPMVYAAAVFWNASVGSTAFGSLPLWVPDFGVTCPNLPTGWSAWVVWQYSVTGTVSGIPGMSSVDLDEFNGDLAALQAFASANAPDSGTTDAGSPVDAEAGTDAPTGEAEAGADAEPGGDAATNGDAEAGSDAATIGDAQTGGDAETSGDAGTSADAGTGGEAGGVMDAGAAQGTAPAQQGGCSCLEAGEIPKDRLPAEVWLALAGLGLSVAGWRRRSRPTGTA
jgi:lysozyme